MRCACLRTTTSFIVGLKNAQTCGRTVRARQVWTAIESQPRTADGCGFTLSIINLGRSHSGAAHSPQEMAAMNSEHFFRLADALRGLATDPRNTVHGPIIDSGRVALLAVFAAFFDRTKKNIQWSRDSFA
jgi:hypothetical protein